MFYLLRDDGSVSLLDGSLVQGVICKKAGWLFNRKWLPLLSPNRLSQLGLLEKAHTLLDQEDVKALLADTGIMCCAYRPGSISEGTILDENQFPSFLVEWLRSSGIGERIFPSQEPQGAAAFAFKMKLGMFLDWAKEYLIEVGPEISPQRFQEAMLRALKRAGLPV